LPAPRRPRIENTVPRGTSKLMSSSTSISPIDFVVLAAVPVALVIGVVVKAKKAAPQKAVRTGDEPVAHDKGGPGGPE
jgi:hypothetical protein